MYNFVLRLYWCGASKAQRADDLVVRFSVVAHKLRMQRQQVAEIRPTVGVLFNVFKNNIINTNNVFII